MPVKNELLGTLLGDSYIGANKGKYSFRVDHCPEQLDYLNHIADILRETYNKHVSVYFRNNRNIHCLYMHGDQFKDFREKYYPNNKKSLKTILEDITDPTTALAYWLMDDGCIHYSTKNPNMLSPRFLLATCAESDDSLEFIKGWLKKHFDVDAYITIQKNHARQKAWPLIKFTVGDSCRIWSKVRHKIIHIPSMKHKFRIAEQEFKREFYRSKYLHES